MKLIRTPRFKKEVGNLNTGNSDHAKIITAASDVVDGLKTGKLPKSAKMYTQGSSPTMDFYWIPVEGKVAIVIGKNKKTGDISLNSIGDKVPEPK